VSEDYLSIASLSRDSVVDGPGLRHVLFLAGCSHNPHCSGCHNPHLWDIDAGILTTISALHFLLSDYIIGYVGLTISGGEPLDQYTNLCKLIELLNKKRYHANRFNLEIPAHDVMIYTGYIFKEIQRKFPRILQLADIIVDGRYEQSKPPAKWRGSNNQRIWQRQKDGSWLLSAV